VSSNGYSPAWLSLREGADAAARSADLVHLLDLSGRRPDPLVIHDLGCGTGAMGRWLAPRLPGPQRWVMYDRDPALLELAAATMVDRATDGTEVTVRTRRADVTRLTGADLAGASLVTCSALLDLLTAAEVDRLADACAAARTPALLTLSVVGRVEFSPADPFDAALAGAFDAHQRRRAGDRALLGPDAADVAAAAFTARGATVDARPSPWRLTPGPLLEQWLRGWVDAALEQAPGLAGPAEEYLDRRLAEGAGTRVEVQHRDLLIRFR
jgi:SAM-dependent methyltransferase